MAQNCYGNEVTECRQKVKNKTMLRCFPEFRYLMREESIYVLSKRVVQNSLEVHLKMMMMKRLRKRISM